MASSYLRISLILVALGVVGCGGKDNPAGPPPAPPAPVIPNYTGIWTGNYVVTSCTQNGTIALANLCGSASPGTSLPFLLNIAQTAVTNSVQGTFTLGTIPFTIVPTSVSSTGTLTVSGTSLSNGITILTTWILTTPIVGTQTQVWSASSLTGQVNISSAIGTVTKTGSVTRAPISTPHSFEELIRALLH